MFKTGDQIGSYSLLEKLGRGAFGEVWLAEEKTAISAHKVALKLPNESDVDLEAIRQEADVWEQVKGHPNILPIIKADIYEGQIYIASEYAPDGSLSEWLKNHDGKAPTVEIAAEMTKGILSGLEHLHSKGVIHRDLKPANILLQAHTPRIADFGIARLMKADAATGTTMSAGTPSYMAPECFYSVRSEQTDIWAVGVLLHKLLSGKLPFSHPDQVSVMNAILNDEPTIDPEIPEFLQRVIRKALQKDTALRYKTAAEMREDLNNFNPAILANEDTLAEQLPVVPVKPLLEKEEETVVRLKSAASSPPPPMPQPVPQVIRVREEAVAVATGSSGSKTLVIGLTAFLVLLAVTAWAALQFGGSGGDSDSKTSPSGYSNLSNQSNSSSNLFTGGGGNSEGLLGNRTNGLRPLDERKSSDTSTTIPGSQGSTSVTDGETNSSAGEENSAPTPFPVEPDQTTTLPSGANGRQRRQQQPRQNVTPNEEETPPPMRTPAENQDDEDEPPPPAQQPRSRPTPRSKPKTEETPPVMEKSATEREN